MPVGLCRCNSGKKAVTKSVTLARKVLHNTPSSKIKRTAT